MKKEKDRGFISWIILVLVALGLLKYFFDWSAVEFLSSEKGQETLKYAKLIGAKVWSLASVPLEYIWREVVWPLIQYVRK